MSYNIHIKVLVNEVEYTQRVLILPTKFYPLSQLVQESILNMNSLIYRISCSFKIVTNFYVYKLQKNGG